MAAVAVAKADIAAVVAEGVVKADREVLVDRAGGLAASASISARRRSASFVLRRWISSTTSAPTFLRNSSRNAARFCHVA